MTQSRLHVPHPPARPGEKPDFSYLEIPPAGHEPRPDTLTPALEIERLGTGMVRVLDEQGHAVGAWNPHLEPEDDRDGLAAAPGDFARHSHGRGAAGAGGRNRRALRGGRRLAQYDAAGGGVGFHGGHYGRPGQSPPMCCANGDEMFIACVARFTNELEDALHF